MRNEIDLFNAVIEEGEKPIRVSDLLDDLNDAAGNIKVAASSLIENTIRAGQRLIQLKEFCEHGEFTILLNELTDGISHSTANRWMNVARAAEMIEAHTKSSRDDFDSLNKMLQFARDLNEEQEILESASVVSIDNGMPTDDRERLAEYDRQQAEWDQAYQDHERWKRRVIEQTENEIREAQAAHGIVPWEEQPGYEDEYRKAKWNWDQVVKEYGVPKEYEIDSTDDIRFMLYDRLTTFVPTCATVLAVDDSAEAELDDDLLYKAFCKELMFGRKLREKTKKHQVLTPQNFHDGQRLLKAWRIWHEKLGMIFERMDQEGFDVTEPMPKDPEQKKPNLKLVN